MYVHKNTYTYDSIYIMFKNRQQLSIIEGKILATSVGEGADWKETMRSLLKVLAIVHDMNVHLKKKP